MECIPPPKKTTTTTTTTKIQVDSFKVASHPRRDNVGKEIFYSSKIDLTPIFVKKKKKKKKKKHIRKNIVSTRSYGQNSVLFTYCH